MNDAQIPAELATEQQQALHAEQQAQKRLLEQEQQRLDRSKRLRDSLKSLAGNADFEFWMTNYLKGDVEIKLKQLEKVAIEDLPLARQRWIDAKGMLSDLQEAVAEAREN
jgi:hypothetical protein